MYIFNTVKNCHHLDKNTFKDLRLTIAKQIDESFAEFCSVYMECSENCNPVEMAFLANELVKRAEKFNVNKDLLAFLTCKYEYTANSELCGQIADLIEHTEIGNKPITNLPTFYKFFKRAYNRNYEICYNETGTKEGGDIVYEY